MGSIRKHGQTARSSSTSVIKALRCREYTALPETRRQQEEA
jgi:hypothetical protein